MIGLRLNAFRVCIFRERLYDSKPALGVFFCLFPADRIYVECDRLLTVCDLVDTLCAAVFPVDRPGHRLVVQRSDFQM